MKSVSRVIALALALALLLDSQWAQAFSFPRTSFGSAPSCLQDQALLLQLTNFPRRLGTRDATSTFWKSATTLHNLHVHPIASLIDPWKRADKYDNPTDYRIFTLLKAPAAETVVLFAGLVILQNISHVALWMAVLHTLLEWVYLWMFPGERPKSPHSWGLLLLRQGAEFSLRILATLAFLIPFLQFALVRWVHGSLSEWLQIGLIINSVGLSYLLHFSWNWLLLEDVLPGWFPVMSILPAQWTSSRSGSGTPKESRSIFNVVPIRSAPPTPRQLLRSL